MEKYLVQRIIDGESHAELMTKAALINYIDMDDCHGEDYKVFDVSEFGKVKELEYVGWQPHCLIKLKDANGNVVVSGYGTDH